MFTIFFTLNNVHWYVITVQNDINTKIWIYYMHELILIEEFCRFFAWNMFYIGSSWPQYLGDVISNGFRVIRCTLFKKSKWSRNRFKLSMCSTSFSVLLLFHLIFALDQAKTVLSNEIIENLCGLRTVFWECKWKIVKVIIKCFRTSF